MTIEQFNQMYGNDPEFLRLLNAANQERATTPGSFTAYKALQAFTQSKGLDAHNTLTQPTATGGAETYATHPVRDFIKDAALSAGLAGAGALALGPFAADAPVAGMGDVGPVAAAGGTTASKIPAALAGGSGASSGIADILKKLALGLAPLGAGVAAHALGPSQPQPPQVPDELKQLLALAMKRASDQQPLVDRVNAGQLAGLPRLT